MGPRAPGLVWAPQGVGLNHLQLQSAPVTGLWSPWVPPNQSLFLPAVTITTHSMTLAAWTFSSHGTGNMPSASLPEAVGGAVGRAGGGGLTLRCVMASVGRWVRAGRLGPRPRSAPRD